MQITNIYFILKIKLSHNGNATQLINDIFYASLLIYLLPLFIYLILTAMRKLLTALLLLTALNAVAQPNPAELKMNKLGWLVGKWTRTNARPGTSGYEQWGRASLTELKGFGARITGKDTTITERTTLVLKDNAIYYIADVKENEHPVYFKLTQLTDNSFICENPEHDFPKMIAYTLNGNKLKATISGDGKSIDYLFIKAKD